MRSTSSAWAAVSGSEISRRWMIRSASTTSSSVARNAATRCVGRSEMKPTVSDRITGVPCGSRTRRKRRVERGEQHVLGQHPCPGQPVEQCRLAGIGVADDGDHRERHLLALGAVQVAGAPHRLQLALQLDDLVLQRAPVGFDLRFARAAKEAARRRAGVQGGSSCAPAGLSGSSDGQARPAASLPWCGRVRRRSRGSARCGRALWRSTPFRGYAAAPASADGRRSPARPSRL